VRANYFKDVARICDGLKVPFFNLNTSPEFNASKWLFVDRVHLTDQGCELSAELLKREFWL
jgi:lysophospholipase L1-like esterase